MAKPISFPLYDMVSIKNTSQRALNVTILFLLFALLIYRLISLQNHGLAWFVAFLCEAWFTFIWILTTNIQWTPIEYKTYPERLEETVLDLPPVDMFVTTADPVLEPPIITVNTMLSLLAVDYPPHKLACYVSDDGCSPLVFYSLVEASKFAKLWVPFCKKHNVQVRAPFRYFSNESSPADANLRDQFQEEWEEMKDMYNQLSQKIEAAAQKSSQSCSIDLTSELSVFSNMDCRNHSTMVKVIWENEERSSDGIPHVIYISREKRPYYDHNYKAGAMNVLSRVSGLMTNAPFMLNVDCDMFSNNPKIVREAMCLLLGSRNEIDCGFVQFPQLFYDGPSDQVVILNEYMVKGVVGIQGPLYEGTGFHRRKVIYGLRPDDIEIEGRVASVNEKLTEDKLLIKEFGSSKEFIKSVAHAMKGKIDCKRKLTNSVEAAYLVAGCAFEDGTNWGKKVGWLYGSKNEDILTGLIIHKNGWGSSFCSPNTPAFLGCAPSSGPTSMTQQKRWATGLLEILLSKHNPIFATISGKLQFRQCLGYLWVLIWGLRSMPELCYAALPAYCIITNSNFLPKVQELGIYIPVALFVTYNLHTLSEYLQSGFSIRSWWTNQRMARLIITMCAWLFAFSSVILKLLGLSETVFEVTHKDQSTSTDGSNADDDEDHEDEDELSFDESPIFVPGTTILLVHLFALATSLPGLLPHHEVEGRQGSGPGEFMCSMYVVACFWPFVKGLFRRGRYGIPKSTICKSVILAVLFVHLSWTKLLHNMNHLLM